MTLRPLLLPVTIRTATEGELPKTEAFLERLRLSKDALLVNGFSFTDTQEDRSQYNFFSEINIDNQYLWALIKRLIMDFPDYVCLVFNHIDADPSYSKYIDKFEMSNKLDKYQQELSMDGYLEFGIVFQDDEILLELFIKKAKYIQFWGMDEVAFRDAMQEFNLTEVPSINFIDEYPLVTEALRLHRPDLIETTEMLKILSGF
jgi:hypothetical protein